MSKANKNPTRTPEIDAASEFWPSGWDGRVNVGLGQSKDKDGPRV